MNLWINKLIFDFFCIISKKAYHSLINCWDLFTLCLLQNSAFLALLPVVRQRILDGFSPKALDLYRREFDFFDQVTSISGVLFPLPKDERRAGIKRYYSILGIYKPDFLGVSVNTWYLVLAVEVGAFSNGTTGNWRKFNWKEKTFIYLLLQLNWSKVFRWTVEYLCSRPQKFQLWLHLMWLIGKGIKLI